MLSCANYRASVIGQEFKFGLLRILEDSRTEEQLVSVIYGFYLGESAIRLTHRLMFPTLPAAL